MVFYHGKLRMELSTTDNDVKMEITSEDGINHVHVIPLKDYLSFLRLLSAFNVDFINNTGINVN